MTQQPLRILSLDGGGVRGISSLYILKELMRQITREHGANDPGAPDISPRPCEYFDLICGTSTGGLIALMLGRLRMSVDDAILKYKILSKRVFSSSSNDPYAAFDAKVLEQEIKNIVAAAGGGQSPSMQLKDIQPDICPTFVIATSLRAGGAVRMRSFGTRYDDPFQACIWQVARATSAAPTYFLPITIDDVKYGDGGTGWNNPAKEAIAEARNMWPDRPIGILVSIGTGLEEALQLNDTSREIPKVVELLLQNTSPVHTFKLAVAEYAVKCVTSCELVHGELSEHCDRDILEGNYFRLNVPQGMAAIGLAEWDKLGDMIALTNGYMNHGEMKRKKQRIAELLRDPQRVNIKPRQKIAKYLIVPPWCQKNPHFTGRTSLLKKLLEMLSDDNPQKHKHRVALSGLGGVGKTQCAIEYVLTQQSNYDAIFWITAVDLSALLLGFQEIAKVTGCTEPYDNSSELATKVVTWLADRGRWLLVLDNLDDIEVVKNFLPDTMNGGHTLITTRNPFALNIPAQGLEVSVLDDKEATNLLLLRAELETENEHIKSEASQIVNELGFLPLALDQAAAYIRVQLKKDIFEFRTIYKSYRKQIHLERPGGHWPYHSEIATTWLLSFKAVRDRNESVSNLLKLFAFLNPDGILVDFLQAGKAGLPDALQKLIENAFIFKNALRDLEQFSLIQRHDNGQVISIHRLVQSVIRDGLNSEEEIEFMSLITNMFLCAFPPFKEDKRQICRRYQTQVVRPLRGIISLHSESVALICLRIAYFLLADGKLYDCLEFEQAAINIYTDLFGEEHPGTLSSMNNLAATYRALGRANEAAALHEKVLEAWGRTLGEEHPGTLLSMNNLAATYRALGRANEAAALHEKVLEARGRTLGEEHPDTLRSMNNLAETYRALGRANEAAALHEKVLEAWGRTLGEEHPDTLRSMNNLAATYRALGRANEAAALHEKVLEAWGRTLGEEHPDMLSSIYNLAVTYWCLSRRNEAIELFERELNLCQQIYGAEHNETLTSIKSLIKYYYEMGYSEHEIKRRLQLMQLVEDVQLENNT